jgi:hypothetical protein
MKLLLEKASQNEITRKEITNTVAEHGFSESELYFTPDAISQNDGYGLLYKTPAGYRSVLKSNPAEFLTGLQRRFIKTILQDNRIKLFLNEQEIEELKLLFKEVEPLFNPDDYINVETVQDRDDCCDDKYIRDFRTILSAVQDKKTLTITYNTSRNSRNSVMLVPYKIEYALRDDKFRLCGVRISKGMPRTYYKINIARVLNINVLDESYNLDFDKFIQAKKRKTPLEIEIYNSRNAFERFFIGLSNYERISTYDEETQTCRMKIHYTEDDEPELMIHMMSFGPVIKVLEPESFRDKFIARIKKQQDLFNIKND